jgi:hypothetical protein
LIHLRTPQLRILIFSRTKYSTSNLNYLILEVLALSLQQTNISLDRINNTHEPCQELWLQCKKKNSMVWVREQTTPTERPQLVGEVIANFLRIERATWSAWRIPTAVFSVF